MALLRLPHPERAGSLHSKEAGRRSSPYDDTAQPPHLQCVPPYSVPSISGRHLGNPSSWTADVISASLDIEYTVSEIMPASSDSVMARCRPGHLRIVGTVFADFRGCPEQVRTSP